MQAGVLLVDDDDAFRAVARDVLRAAGFRVTAEAATGLGALAIAQKVRPSIVVLDVQLPDIDGFEVLRRLRDGSPSGSPSPDVVLISTREAADYGLRVTTCGAAGFITKSRLSGAALRAILHPIGREDG